MNRLRLLTATVLSAAFAVTSTAQISRPDIGQIGNPQMAFIKAKIDFERIYRCGPGETKTFIMHGVDDGFAAGNTETAQKNPDLAAYAPWTTANEPNFDGTITNRKFFDYIDIPSNATKGKLYIGLRPNGGNVGTDGMYFGDLSDIANGVPPASRNTGGYGFNTNWLFGADSANWSQAGTDYRVSLDGVTLQNSQTLLDYVQSGSGTTRVDLYVQDDHSVDYWAIGVCTKPDIPKPVSNDFSCYDLMAHERETYRKTLSIVDQFGNSRSVVGHAISICNPAGVNAREFNPKDHPDHLVCYEVFDEKTDRRKEHRVKIENKMEDNVLVTGAIDRVCLVSSKEHIRAKP